MSRQFRKKSTTNKTSGRPNKQGELRIIAGKWRSRKVTFQEVEGLRPSPSRIRETLFNWLNPILAGSRCLDLFAGSGALGFEALSRGADAVTMVEQNKQVVRQLDLNRRQLEANELQILHQDGRQLDTIEGSFDIIFCDPPFNKGFVQPLLDNLHQSGLLNSSARIYLETEKQLEELSLPANWSLLKEKVSGDVRYRLIDVGER